MGPQGMRRLTPRWKRYLSRMWSPKKRPLLVACSSPSKTERGTRKYSYRSPEANSISSTAVAWS